MIGNEPIGPFRVPEGLKLSADTSCAFLENSLEPWLDNLPLARLKKIIFMHDNAPFHAAKTTTQFLTLLRFVTKTLIVWRPKPPDLNSIENLWSIIKRHVYAMANSIHRKMICGMSMAIETSPHLNPQEHHVKTY